MIISGFINYVDGYRKYLIHSDKVPGTGNVSNIVSMSSRAIKKSMAQTVRMFRAIYGAARGISPGRHVSSSKYFTGPSSDANIGVSILTKVPIGVSHYRLVLRVYDIPVNGQTPFLMYEELGPVYSCAHLCNQGPDTNVCLFCGEPNPGILEQYKYNISNL